MKSKKQAYIPAKHDMKEWIENRIKQPGMDKYTINMYKDMLAKLNSGNYNKA